MARPTRRHRQARPVSAILVPIGWIAGLVTLHVFLDTFSEYVGGFGFVFLIVVPIAAAMLVGRFRERRDRRAARDVERWEQTAGWEPAAGPWPWQPLVRWADTVAVLRAYGKRVEGLPVRAGELIFEDNGLGNTVDRWAGRAAFAVVTLPRPLPSMAVRLIRNPHRRRPPGDLFEQQFQPVGLAEVSPGLRAAHLAGEIPAWTVTGDELFVFVPLDGPLRPHDLEEAAREAVLVVSHLGT